MIFIPNAACARLNAESTDGVPSEGAVREPRLAWRSHIRIYGRSRVFPDRDLRTR